MKAIDFGPTFIVLTVLHDPVDKGSTLLDLSLCLT